MNVQKVELTIQGLSAGGAEILMLTTNLIDAGFDVVVQPLDDAAGGTMIDAERPRNAPAPDLADTLAGIEKTLDAIQDVLIDIRDPK